MNFEELGKIIAKEAGINICPICGIPFRKYHSRQRTCGDDECKRRWHNQYLDNRRRRMLADDPDGFRAYRREAERKTRRKKKDKELMGRNYDKLQEYWQKQEELAAHPLDGGMDYGKRQTEKTLAQVPKIDVSGFRKESEK